MPPSLERPASGYLGAFACLLFKLNSVEQGRDVAFKAALCVLSPADFCTRGSLCMGCDNRASERGGEGATY